MQKIAVATGSGVRAPATPIPASAYSRILITATSYLLYGPNEISPNPLDTTNYATQVAADEANTTANLGTIPSATSWIDIGTGSTATVAGTTWALHCSGRAATIQQASNDSTLFKFTVIPGDLWPTDVSGKDRAEFRRNTNFSFNTAYELNYLLYIGAPNSASPTITDTNDGWLIIGQVHHTEDAGDAQGMSPPWMREISFHRTHTLKHRTSQTDPLLSSPSSVSDFTSTTFPYGSWIRVKEQHFFDPSTSSGYHRVWYDGVPVSTYTGKTGYVDAVGPYYKIGIYRYADPDRTQVVMIQGMTIT